MKNEITKPVEWIGFILREGPVYAAGEAVRFHAMHLLENFAWQRCIHNPMRQG